jgi:Ni/Co efflux regulator RcnB
MRFLTTTALSLALLAAGAAYADPNDNNHHTNTTGHTTTTRSPPIHAPGAGGPGGPHGANNNTTAPGPMPFEGVTTGHNPITGNNYVPNNVTLGGHGPTPTFNRNLRTRDAGRAPYNASAFPQVFQASRHFSIAPYVYPGGWYYRAWGYGEFLPRGWFAANYYLDWGSYGLPPPPAGCEWIQEGTDALLVDVFTGEVLSVEPGVFYWS